MEIGGAYSSDTRTPFWLQSNQWGIVPREGTFATLRAGLSRKTSFKGKKDSLSFFQLSGGVEGVYSFTENGDHQWLAPVFYGAVDLGPFEIYAGRRRQFAGLADSTVGLGSFMWSGNAMPITRLQIGLKEFTPFPWTKEVIWFTGFYSDGLFSEDREFTSELKLHQKALYGQVRLFKQRLRLTGGFNHQVQWGGRSPFWTINGQMPKGWINYKRIVFGIPSDGMVDSATDFDNGNRVGNHLGSIDLGFEIVGAKSSFFFYRQNVYDDGSLYFLINITDGLNGIRYRRKPGSKAFQLTEVVAEVLLSESQGGPDVIWTDPFRRGADNYFNNGQVRDGWSNSGRTVGTPFIPPSDDTEWRWPNYNNNFTSNNRVSVYHLGIAGLAGHRGRWEAKFSYSRNLGTYNVRWTEAPEQFSALLSAKFHTNILGPNTFITSSIGLDFGELYRESTGIFLSIRKEGLLGTGKPDVLEVPEEKE